MKNLRKSVVSSMAVFLLFGSIGSVFATDAEIREKAEPISESSECKSPEIKKSLEERYRDLLLENKELHSQKCNLETEIVKLKAENETLTQNYKKTQKRLQRYRKKLEKKKDCLTKEETQNEIEKAKVSMVLKFADYIRSNPSKKMKHVDMRNFFSDFLTFNINYTNNGDTTLSPLAVKGVAKATVAGGAALTK